MCSTHIPTPGKVSSETKLEGRHKNELHSTIKSDENAAA